jgi:hypothetical protein
MCSFLNIVAPKLSFFFSIEKKKINVHPYGGGDVLLEPAITCMHVQQCFYVNSKKLSALLGVRLFWFQPARSQLYPDGFLVQGAWGGPGG